MWRTLVHSCVSSRRCFLWVFGVNGSGLQKHPGWTCTCSPAALSECWMVFKLEDQVLAISSGCWQEGSQLLTQGRGELAGALTQGPQTFGSRTFQYQLQFSSLAAATQLWRLRGFIRSVPGLIWFLLTDTSHIAHSKILSQENGAKGTFLIKAFWADFPVTLGFGTLKIYK